MLSARPARSDFGCSSNARLTTNRRQAAPSALLRPRSRHRRRTGSSRPGIMHGRGRPHEPDIDPPCAEGSPLSALVCVDGAASVAERALDPLVPAALSTLAAKTTEHTIEDIVAMSGLMTLWACQFPIAVAVRACGLRHDRCSFPMLRAKDMATRRTDRHPPQSR